MPSQRSAALTTGQYPALDDDSLPAVAHRARRGERVADRVEASLGKPPDGAKKGDRGSGLWERVVGIEAALEAMGAKLDTVLAAFAAQAAEREKRGGWAARVGWKIIDTLLPVVIL